MASVSWSALSLSCLLICTPGPVRAAEAQASALQTLASRLSAGIETVLTAESPKPPAVALVVEGDAGILGQEGRIAQELERLLVFRLQAGTAAERAIPLAGKDRVAAYRQAQREGASWLIRCTVGLKRDAIYLSADLSPAHVPFWEGLIDPVPRGSKHHLFVSVKIDEEVGLLLGKARTPPALGSWHLEELLYVPGRVLDLGLGDLDGEPGSELVLLFETSIEVYSTADGPPRHLSSYDLKQIPLGGPQTRDPSGVLLVSDFNGDGRFEVFYKLFNQRWGQVLSFTGSTFRALRKLERVPLCQYRHAERPVILSGLPEAGTNRFAPEVQLADINSSKGQRSELSNNFSVMRCWQGQGGRVWIVAVDDNGGLLRLADDFTQTSRLDGVGAGSGILDLDRDDSPELILSDPVWPGEPDAIRVMAGGEVVWRSKDVVGGVVAVAGGPFGKSGKVQAVFAAVESNSRSSRIYVLGR